jgi:hypothetical protein
MLETFSYPQKNLVPWATTSCMHSCGPVENRQYGYLRFSTGASTFFPYYYMLMIWPKLHIFHMHLHRGLMPWNRFEVARPHHTGINHCVPPHPPGGPQHNIINLTQAKMTHCTIRCDGTKHHTLAHSRKISEINIAPHARKKTAKRLKSFFLPPFATQPPPTCFDPTS